MARVLRSSAFVGMIVPLSSTLAAAEDCSAAHLRPHQISREDMDDVMTYLCSLRGPVIPEGGSAARVLLVAAPSGGGRGASFPNQSWDWFKRFGVSGPQQRGTLCPLGADLAMTLDGNVVKGFTAFGGSLRGAVMGMSFTGRPPTEEEKLTFQYQQFDLQRKLFDVSSKNGNLKLMQILADAEASLNEAKMMTVEEEIGFLKKGQEELKDKTVHFESRVAGEKKMDEAIIILKEILAAGARAAKLEAEMASKVVSSDLKSPPTAYTTNKGRVEQLLFGLRRVEKSYLTFMKFYPILLGAFVWYTSGVEPGEIVLYMEASRVKNKEEVKILLSEFQKQRDEKNTSVASIQDDKAAKEGEPAAKPAAKEDDPAAKPTEPAAKGDDPAAKPAAKEGEPAAKPAAKEDDPAAKPANKPAETAAKGDEPAPKKGRWYLFGY